MGTLKLPKYSELFWPTLVAIKELGGSANNAEILHRVIADLGIPDDVQAILHKSGPNTELNYRLAWARTYLKMVGALYNSSSGVWTMTEKGKRLGPEDMGGIVQRVREIQKSKSSEVSRTTGPLNTPEINEAEQEQEPWKSQLTAVLQQLDPGAFERICQRLLRECGFIDVSVTGRSGDGGIDGTGVLRIGLVTFRTAFQCKRFKGSVGVAEVRDFRGAIQGRAEKGILITTGVFTDGARREARRDGADPVDLINGDELCSILRDRRLGVKVVETVVLEPEFFYSV